MAKIPSRRAFRQINPTRSEEMVGEKLLADIRGLVWRHYGGRFDELAGIARLCTATVENFAFGYTESPRWETIVRLLVALERYELLAQVLQTNTPLTRAEAQKKD